MWDGVTLHGEEEEEEGEGRGGSRGDGAIMEAEERKHSEGAREEIETAVTLQVSGREAGKVGCR